MAIVIDRAAFNVLYVASRHPEILAMMKLPVEQRTPVAQQLVKSTGLKIDEAIDVQGSDAYLEMSERIMFGMTWVPSAGMFPLGYPGGYALPGYGSGMNLMVYDPKSPPPLAIKVSLDSDDYAPFDPPSPVPTPLPVTSAVGINVGGTPPMYFVTAMGREMYETGQLKVGDVYAADPRGKFTLSGSPSPFAPDDMVLWFLKA